jgi:hypothetical protein
MGDKHRIPTNLTPTGDIVVPLSIPHDEQWTGLLLGVLILLEDPDYYQKDPDFDNEDAKVVAARWRDTTINPLIEAIANGTGMRKFTFQIIDLTTNQTTISLVPVAVANSGFNHVFTHKNAIIRCHNSVLSNSGAANLTNAQVDINGESPEAYAIASNEGTNGRSFTNVARFENLPVGVTKQVRLMMFVTGGTGTMSENSKLVWEIEEYP